MENIIQLIEEAKKRYPVGTIFNSTYQEDKNKVINHDFTWANGIAGHTNIIKNSDGGWVYSNDKWAEIVKMGEQINNEPLIFN